jgi:hypothetical protein
MFTKATSPYPESDQRLRVGTKNLFQEIQKFG